MDCYQVLGIPRSATNTEIKDAYLALLSQSHVEEELNASNARINHQNRLLTAYETLADEVKRSVYDANLAPERSPSPLNHEASSSALASGVADLFSPLTDERLIREKQNIARAARAEELHRLKTHLQDLRSSLEEIEEEESERVKARKRAKAAAQTRNVNATTSPDGVASDAWSLPDPWTVLAMMIAARPSHMATEDEGDLSPQAERKHKAAYRQWRRETRSEIRMTQKRLIAGLKVTKELEKRERKERKKEDRRGQTGEV